MNSGAALGFYAMGMVMVHVASHTWDRGERAISTLMLVAGLLQCVIGIVITFSVVTTR